METITQNKMEKIEEIFDKWYEENEIRFHHAQMSEKEISFSAYVKGYQKANEWISVEDRLPEPDNFIEYLVYVDEGTGYPYINTGRFNEWGFHFPSWSNNSGSVQSNITHWQTLPTPPPTKTKN
jgi:hypothetical protein